MANQGHSQRSCPGPVVRKWRKSSVLSPTDALGPSKSKRQERDGNGEEKPKGEPEAEIEERYLEERRRAVIYGPAAPEALSGRS